MSMLQNVEEKHSDEPLHGVRVKRPRRRPKKRLPMDYRKVAERYRVALERYYCLACNSEKKMHPPTCHFYARNFFPNMRSKAMIIQCKTWHCSTFYTTTVTYRELVKPLPSR